MIPAAVHIGDVQVFRDLSVDKQQALKPLEEAAEVFGAFQRVEDAACEVIDAGGPERAAMEAAFHQAPALVGECCDVIQATCNLLAALGVVDAAPAMERCRARNAARGRM